MTLEIFILQTHFFFKGEMDENSRDFFFNLLKSIT